MLHARQIRQQDPDSGRSPFRLARARMARKSSIFFKQMEIVPADCLPLAGVRSFWTAGNSLSCLRERIIKMLKSCHIIDFYQCEMKKLPKITEFRKIHCHRICIQSLLLKFCRFCSCIRNFGVRVFFPPMLTKNSSCILYHTRCLVRGQDSNSGTKGCDRQNQNCIRFKMGSERVSVGPLEYTSLLSFLASVASLFIIPTVLRDFNGNFLAPHIPVSVVAYSRKVPKHPSGINTAHSGGGVVQGGATPILIPRWQLVIAVTRVHYSAFVLGQHLTFASACQNVCLPWQCIPTAAALQESLLSYWNAIYVLETMEMSLLWGPNSLCLKKKSRESLGGLQLQPLPYNSLVPAMLVSLTTLRYQSSLCAPVAVPENTALSYLATSKQKKDRGFRGILADCRIPTSTKLTSLTTAFSASASEEKEHVSRIYVNGAATDSTRPQCHMTLAMVLSVWNVSPGVARFCVPADVKYWSSLLQRKQSCEATKCINSIAGSTANRHNDSCVQEINCQIRLYPDVNHETMAATILSFCPHFPFCGMLVMLELAECYHAESVEGICNSSNGALNLTTTAERTASFPSPVALGAFQATTSICTLPIIHLVNPPPQDIYLAKHRHSATTCTRLISPRLTLAPLTRYTADVIKPIYLPDAISSFLQGGIIHDVDELSGRMVALDTTLIKLEENGICKHFAHIVFHSQLNATLVMTAIGKETSAAA